MAEKIFVIGSNSFSGSSFIAAALAEGANVIGISRSSEYPEVFLPYRWLNDRDCAGFRFYQKDINKDLDAIMELMDDFRPDYVINFAAQGMVAESWDAPEQWLITNLVSAVCLHGRLRKAKYIKKFVQISTPEVYGHYSGKIIESHPYNPSTPYAVSKAACDMSLMTFVRQYQFPVVFTRSANIYGPGQQLYRIVPKAIISIKLGKKLPLHGGGASVRSFIHARDVASGTLKVMRLAKPAEVYHLSTERYVSVSDLVGIICKQMNVSFEDTVEITGERPGKDPAFFLDSSRARNNLGWEGKILLEDGIKETINWVEKNFKVLSTMPLEYIHKA